MKQQRRKPRKRRPPTPKVIDDELIELATMLDERRLDKNAQGWFSVPWHDGWNATALAFHAWLGDFDGDELRGRLIGSWLHEQIKSRGVSADLYWRASDALVELNHSYPRLRASLRCVQILVAKSDGAGEVYNGILRPAFDGHIPEDIEELVERWRMVDALGPNTLNPNYVRRQHAFRIAWRRGLYRAAYAI